MLRKRIGMPNLMVFLLCAGLLAATVSAVRAQEPTTGITATEAPQADTAEGAVERPGRDEALAVQYERSLRMALGVCFEPPADVAEDTDVQIGFDLDAQGRLSGLPALIGGADVSGDMRRLYLAGAMALDRCTPYPPDGAGARFEAAFSRDGIKAIRRVTPPGGNGTRSEQRAAVAVHKPGDQETETALALDRSQRREVQRRLQLLGFDPGGVDGVFGQNTRDAIAAWQEDKGFPGTGYLGAVQLLALNAQSQAEYAQFIATPPKKKTRKKRRVKVCRQIGLLGLRQCWHEYR
ncbi:peptidoglycan-binding domain-containing protein [Marimonas lutisalis]|uniref:peptidoglycan-binding domain-containing protein n=1 Tax=Marimonas lutisalis TaxID=2545756 RepID=UPI0010F754AF|nr:peptidoglycan-binding domain-containing protein [Marimonas lutisalis]